MLLGVGEIQRECGMLSTALFIEANNTGCYANDTVGPRVQKDLCVSVWMMLCVCVCVSDGVCDGVCMCACARVCVCVLTGKAGRETWLFILRLRSTSL